MAPLTAAASAATGTAEGVGGSAGKKIFELLAKRTFRLRVAWAVSRAAKAEGIAVGWKALASWLKGEDVREAVASGERPALRAAAISLVLEVASTGRDADDAATRLVDLVRDESLRRMTEGDGRVSQTRRLEDAIRQPQLHRAHPGPAPVVTASAAPAARTRS